MPVLALLFLLLADSSTDLLNSANRGETAQVKTLLDTGASVDAKDKRGRTPLMLAAQRGHVDTVKLLLAKGADPNARDRDGWTAYGLILLSPSGDLFRKHQEEVLSLLPKPKPWRLKVEGAWSREAVFSSCFLGRDELFQFVDRLHLDDLMSAELLEAAKNSNDGIISIVGPSGDADAVLTIQAKPNITCAQATGDNLSMAMTAALNLADGPAIYSGTFGGGLRGLHVRGVTNPSQYSAIFEGWAKTHTGTIYHNVLGELLKLSR